LFNNSTTKALPIKPVAPVKKTLNRPPFFYLTISLLQVIPF